MRIASKITDLFTDRIWTLDTSASSPFYAETVRIIKLIRITFSTFIENRMGFQCVSLSYFITLALVPFIAFVFAITGGLGLDGSVKQLLQAILPTHPEIVNVLSERASVIIDSVLVQDFVPFEVQRPIPRAVEQGDALLLAVDESLDLPAPVQSLVPRRRDHADFRIADVPHPLLRTVVARPHRHHELVHQRQGRPDRLLKRELQPHGIPQKGKSTDFHACHLTFPTARLQTIPAAAPTMPGQRREAKRSS